MAATVVFSEPDTSMTTTMVRGRVCLRGLSSVLQLELCSASFPASLPIVATTSPRGQVIRYPLSRHPSCVQATARRLPLLVALSRCRRHAGAGERRPAVPPGLLHPLPLACMYADTADWATSTAESFIRETELIQARLLEWPLACMYADTADWATSTAGSFIRETELIQARLLEWPNGELVPAVQKRCSNPCTCSQAARR
jgi:hypothetical protein